MRALLVCHDGCDEVEECLTRAGCSVIKARNAAAALARARRETFDAAVLVSTGRAMDLTETVLNLRDITHDMEIVIVAGTGVEKEEPVETLARSLPHMTIIQLEHLQEVFQTTTTHH